MEVIISALIGAAGAIIVCVIQNSTLAQKQKAQLDTAIALINLKIDQLTAQVEKHNNLVERTYQLERDVTLNEEKIKVANHRIDDLEGGVHHE